VRTQPKKALDSWSLHLRLPTENRRAGLPLLPPKIEETKKQPPRGRHVIADSRRFNKLVKKEGRRRKQLHTTRHDTPFNQKPPARPPRTPHLYPRDARFLQETFRVVPSKQKRSPSLPLRQRTPGAPTATAQLKRTRAPRPRSSDWEKQTTKRGRPSSTSDPFQKTKREGKTDTRSTRARGDDRTAGAASTSRRTQRSNSPPPPVAWSWYPQPTVCSRDRSVQ